MRTANAPAFGLGLLAALLLADAGCGGSSNSKVASMEIDADAGEKAVKEFDANGDGKLDYSELAKAPGLRAGIATIKKLAVFRGPAPSQSQLQSATITADEVTARIKEWKSKGGGRIGVSCRVVHLVPKGRSTQQVPLVGAEVKFVPEKFLGNGLTTGVGTTDKQGVARVSQASRGGSDPASGMCAGFYRVEITKGGEIPAKYNQGTTLGAEVAPDVSVGDRLFQPEY